MFTNKTSLSDADLEEVLRRSPKHYGSGGKRSKKKGLDPMKDSWVFSKDGSPPKYATTQRKHKPPSIEDLAYTIRANSNTSPLGRDDNLKVNVLYNGMIYRVKGFKIICSILFGIFLLLIATLALGIWIILGASENGEIYFPWNQSDNKPTKASEVKDAKMGGFLNLDLKLNQSNIAEMRSEEIGEILKHLHEINKNENPFVKSESVSTDIEEYANEDEIDEEYYNDLLEEYTMLRAQYVEPPEGFNPETGEIEEASRERLEHKNTAVVAPLTDWKPIKANSVNPLLWKMTNQQLTPSENTGFTKVKQGRVADYDGLVILDESPSPTDGDDRYVNGFVENADKPTIASLNFGGSWISEKEKDPNRYFFENNYDSEEVLLDNPFDRQLRKRNLYNEQSDTSISHQFIGPDNVKERRLNRTPLKPTADPYKNTQKLNTRPDQKKHPFNLSPNFRRSQISSGFKSTLSLAEKEYLRLNSRPQAGLNHAKKINVGSAGNEKMMPTHSRRDKKRQRKIELAPNPFSEQNNLLPLANEFSSEKILSLQNSPWLNVHQRNSGKFPPRNNVVANKVPLRPRNPTNSGRRILISPNKGIPSRTPVRNIVSLQKPPEPQEENGFLKSLSDMYAYSKRLASTLISLPSKESSVGSESSMSFLKNSFSLLYDYNNVFSNLPEAFMEPLLHFKLPSKKQLDELSPFQLSLVTWTFIDFWEFLIEKVGTLSTTDLRALEYRLSQIRNKADSAIARSLMSNPNDTDDKVSISISAEDTSSVSRSTINIEEKSEDNHLMKHSIKTLLNFGKIYLQKDYTMDCMMLLFCREINRSTKKEGMDGVAAKLKSVGLKVLVDQEGRERDTINSVWQALTAWQPLQCDAMFPRCDGSKALEIVNEVANASR